MKDRLNQYFDTAVFSQAGIFTFGNTSRTSPDLRMPSLHNIDFSIFKNFPLREGIALRYQAEFYNGTNTPLWAAPGTTVNAASGFGPNHQRQCAAGVPDGVEADILRSRPAPTNAATERMRNKYGL